MAKTKHYRATYKNFGLRQSISFWTTSQCRAWGKAAAWLAANRPDAVLLDVVEVGR